MGSLSDLTGEAKRDERERDAAAYARLEMLTEAEIKVLLEMAGCFHPPYALWKVGRRWQLLDVSFDSMRYGFVNWPTTNHRTVLSLKERGLIERTENGLTEEYGLSERGRALMTDFFRLAKKEYDAINKGTISHPTIPAKREKEDFSTCTEPSTTPRY